MNSLSGKVALITGAANGIGAGTARALAHKGARLILTDLEAEPLERLADELGHDNVVTSVCDVCDLDSMEAAVAAGVERFGGIDLVLANAGIASYGSVLGVDPEAFRRVIDVNLIGVFHTVRAALPSVIERRGYILVVSSLAAYAPAPVWPPTTPARRASSTSPAPCASRSPTVASTSARRTCPGSTRRWCATRARTSTPSARCSPSCPAR